MKNQQGYNNCFVLAWRRYNPDAKKLIKSPCYIGKNGFYYNLRGGTGENRDEELYKYYKCSYEAAKDTITNFKNGTKRQSCWERVRVSLWLDNAMFGDLHIFVMDFDLIDEESEFFNKAKALADKVTRSQDGGYHMFYGIDKEKARPLFDEINLLCGSPNSFVCYTGAVTNDEKNKVDFFCDSGRLIYEWEEWDNTKGLTDKTQEVFELIRDNFNLTRAARHTSNQKQGNRGKGNHIQIADLSEDELIVKMKPYQKEIFADLKTESSDCDKKRWYYIGYNIYAVFGEKLGGEVFLWWSKPGHSFRRSTCSEAWEYICATGDGWPRISQWLEIFERGACVF